MPCVIRIWYVNHVDAFNEAFNNVVYASKSHSCGARSMVWSNSTSLLTSHEIEVVGVYIATG